MNRKKLCVFLLTMTNFVKQVSADSSQSKRNRIDRLVHEVGERIKAREKHIGNEETQPDSIITCYEKDIDPKTIFGMYQSLCNKTAHEDEATMITVSFCSEGNDEDSKKKLTANFIYALQSQIDSNRTYTHKDGLYLTLDHIRYADVEHLDLLNSHVMQMRSIHKKFDVKFIKKMEEIAYIFLERKIMQRYEIIISAMVNIPTSDGVKIDCNMKNKEKVLKVILGFFEDFESYGCPIDVINSICRVFQHSMNRMISEIVADSDQLSSEKDNLNADLTDYFKYLATKKFYTSLLRCVNDLAISFSNVFEKAETKKAFSDFYSCFIEKINKRIELSQKKIGSFNTSHHDSNVEHKNQRALDAARAAKTSKQSEDCDLLVNLDRNLSDERKDYDSLDEIEDTSGTDLPFEREKYSKRHVVEQVMQDSNLRLMYQSFFRSLFELILRSFQTSMQTQKDNILDKLYSEKEFTIVINGIVTPDNFYDLVRIVNDGNILEGSCDGQVLFIVKGKSLTYSDIGIYDPRRDNVNLDLLLPSITLKVLSKITPTNIGSFDNANHLGKYKTHETKVTKDGCKTHQETFEAPNENPHVVGLFEAHIPHETSDDTVNCLMTRCQEHGGQIITHNIVLIVKDTESIGIHILFQRRDDTNRTEIISIIYNPKPIAEKHDLRCFTTLEAKTICLFNVPVTILNDLDHSLMCLLVQDTKFNIPNILTLQNRNLIYTEQIIDIENNRPFVYLHKYFIQKFDCDKFFRISNSISIKDIAKYLYKKNYGGDNVIIDAFVKKIGIQLDEFNDILHSVIFNGRSLEADADWSFEVDRVNTGFEVVVYMTHHDDNSRVLNICQAEENRYGDKISISPYSIFRKLLENEEFCPILQNMNHDTEPSVPEKAFIMLVFNKIYEHICYNSSAYSGRCNLDKRKKEYAKDIVENIHIMIDQNQKSFDNKSPGSQAYHTQLQQFLLKLAVPETIERMFETMIKEMLKIKWQRTMKITSIKFSNMGDNAMCNGSDKLSERSNAKFVDVEHLTCQDCQSLQGCRECQNCVAKMQQHTTSK